MNDHTLFGFPVKLSVEVDDYTILIERPLKGITEGKPTIDLDRFQAVIDQHRLQKPVRAWSSDLQQPTPDPADLHESPEDAPRHEYVTREELGRLRSRVEELAREVRNLDSKTGMNLIR